MKSRRIENAVSHGLLHFLSILKTLKHYFHFYRLLGNTLVKIRRKK